MRTDWYSCGLDATSAVRSASPIAVRSNGRCASHAGQAGARSPLAVDAFPAAESTAPGPRKRRAVDRA